jgi:hypothetical protein
MGINDIAAIFQISTFNKRGDRPEGKKLSVFRLLNGYITTTGGWNNYNGFMHMDYFHEVYDEDSLKFWIENWCEDNLSGFFDDAENYEIENIRGNYPEITYRQYTQGKKLTIAYRPDTPVEITAYATNMAVKYLLEPTTDKELEVQHTVVF